MSTQRDALKAGVIAVDGGRGFVIEIHRHYFAPGHGWVSAPQRLVVTAAHCLPRLPPAHGAATTPERTYAKLLGPRDRRRRARPVWAECFYADPVADLAVLGAPDDQTFPEQADAYDTLVGDDGLVDVPVFTITGAKVSESRGWMLTFDDEWAPCEVNSSGERALWIHNAMGGIRAGTSGSPIVNDDGDAVGVVCIGSKLGRGDTDRSGGPNPVLVQNLPGWVLDGLARRKRASSDG